MQIFACGSAKKDVKSDLEFPEPGPDATEEEIDNYFRGGPPTPQPAPTPQPIQTAQNIGTYQSTDSDSTSSAEPDSPPLQPRILESTFEQTTAQQPEASPLVAEVDVSNNVESDTRLPVSPVLSYPVVSSPVPLPVQDDDDSDSEEDDSVEDLDMPVPKLASKPKERVVAAARSRSNTTPGFNTNKSFGGTKDYETTGFGASKPMHAAVRRVMTRSKALGTFSPDI